MISLHHAGEINAICVDFEAFGGWLQKVLQVQVSDTTGVEKRTSAGPTKKSDDVKTRYVPEEE